MKGTLFLSGGGNERQTLQLDSAFIQALISRGNRLLYIPIALNRSVLGFEACFDWISVMISLHTRDFIKVTMWADISNKEEKSLNEFDAIYIGGGNTFKLRAQLASSGLDEALKAYLFDGGLVYGGSAGAIVFGKSLRTVKEENDADYKLESGLGLLRGYSLRCHYHEEDEDRLSAIATKEALEIIGLPEEAGIIFKSSGCNVVGNEANLFKSDGSSSVLMQGRYEDLF